MSSSGLIRAMVVDDHPIVRNGLRDALEGSGRFEVVGLAGDGTERCRKRLTAFRQGHKRILQESL